jgi:hypothetical protein
MSRKKVVRFRDKPSDTPNIQRCLYFDQKSFYCEKCGAIGPWWKRKEHVCVKGKKTQCPWCDKEASHNG